MVPFKRRLTFLSSCQVGTIYHGVNDLPTALRFYEEALSRGGSDRLFEGMISRSTAMVLANLGQFKSALEKEKNAHKLFSALLGENHQLTKQSDQALKRFTASAVQHGNKVVEDRKKKKEDEAADAIASQIEAEEAAEQEKKKKKNKKRGKGKK